MLRMGEPTAPEDFGAKALPTRPAPPEARGLFLIFVCPKHQLARSKLNDEQIELSPHDRR